MKLLLVMEPSQDMGTPVMRICNDNGSTVGPTLIDAALYVDTRYDSLVRMFLSRVNKLEMNREKLRVDVPKLIHQFV